MMLEQGRCHSWIEKWTIYTGLMMMEPARYEMEARGRKVNMRGLLQQ